MNVKFFSHKKGKFQKIMIIFAGIVKFIFCIKPQDEDRFK